VICKFPCSNNGQHEAQLLSSHCCPYDTLILWLGNELCLIYEYLQQSLWLWGNFNPSVSNTLSFVTDQSRHVMKRTLPLRPRILLLYSRDCKPFMNMMATFREMLKQVMKCEVRAYIIHISDSNFFCHRVHEWRICSVYLEKLVVLIW
jgi:hypothetical protein